MYPPTQAPTRKTSEVDLNAWNTALRASPGYKKFLASIGKDPNHPVGLNDHEQAQLEQTLAQAGVPVPKGMHIDHAGNLNQKNTLVRNTAIAVGITAATLATAGAAGFGPLAGAMGGAGGAGGAGAAAASATMPTATAGIVGGVLPGAAMAIPGATAAAGIGGTGAAMASGGSVLSRLAKYGKTASDISSNLSPVLGGMAASRGDALQNQERNQLSRDSLNLSAANLKDRSILDRAGLDMDQRKFQLAAPAARMGDSVRGSIMSRAHNVTAGAGAPMTLSSGHTINPIHYNGVGPDDLLNDNTRQLGDAVTGQMLEAQLKGDKFDPLPTVDFPSPAPAPQSGGMDKAIGAGAGIAGVLGAMSPVLQRILAKKKAGPTGLDNMQLPGEQFPIPGGG